MPPWEQIFWIFLLFLGPPFFIEPQGVALSGEISNGLIESIGALENDRSTH